MDDLSVKVDSALPEDAAEMAAIESQCSIETLPAGAMAETGALFRALGENRLVELTTMPTSICLIARTDEAIDGFFIGYRKALALEIYSHLPATYAPEDNVWSEDFVYVKSVAVRLDMIGRRIGSHLLKYFRELSAQTNCPYAITEISVAPLENHRSVRLFRSVLNATELGRHTSPSSGITWGLFKSELLCEKK